MKKTIGGLGLLTAIGAVFMPIVTIYMVWGALLLSAVASLLGSKITPPLTLLVCLANLFFFSPVSTALLGSGIYSLLTTGALVALNIGAMVLGWKLHAG